MVFGRARIIIALGSSHGSICSLLSVASGRGLLACLVLSRLAGGVVEGTCVARVVRVVGRLVRTVVTDVAYTSASDGAHGLTLLTEVTSGAELASNSFLLAGLLDTD